LYNNKELLAKHKISDGSSIFGLGQFMNDPKTFYAIAKELFLPVVRGSFKPTVCHKFISLLHKKGLLLRNYTQNIDMLERHAGFVFERKTVQNKWTKAPFLLPIRLPDEALVESHGTFAKATCLQCNKQVEDMEAFWNDVESDRLPKCAACGGTRMYSNFQYQA
jgi:NAD-dependent SIR2 family protein deacetylase